MGNGDIFDFWADVGGSEQTHPRDREVLGRVNHGLDLRCLPSPFAGPLKTAPLVLLYLSPGFAASDIEEANTRKGQERYFRMRQGHAPLAGPDEHGASWRWWSSRAKVFGPWEALREKVAILNIGAYHSDRFDDGPLLAALPSSRRTLDWAQDVLFPQALAGERVVICMRAARTWGLDKTAKHGASLYAPKVTRSGHMVTADEHAGIREEIIAKARLAVGAAQWCPSGRLAGRDS